MESKWIRQGGRQMKFVASAICALVVVLICTQAPALADPKVEPLDGAKALLKEEKWQPSTTSDRTQPIAGARSREKPMETNAWGGVPCVQLTNGTTQCFGQPAIAPPATPAELTPGDILTAVKKIGMPSLKINIQPGGETLVNLDTIFYARPQPFRRSVDLLGFDIDLVATPVRYTWRHGDGTSHTTSKPGRPYPSKDVIHRYPKSGKNLHPSVDVTYAVRYRVDGGAWQDLSQTLQASGPTGDLDVKEATPVLTRG